MKTVREGEEEGRLLRRTVPRDTHGELALPERDPVGILVEQNQLRVPELVPLRVGRMLRSPFAFYRGTAGVMAHDLSVDVVTGQTVLCCGDAHVSNFGIFASPERRLLFDLNDFDEAATAPWEWDVKRLATSVVLCGRDLGMSESDCRDATEATVRAYRKALRRLYSMSALERFYFQVDADRVERSVTSKHRRHVRRTLERSRARTSEQVRDKLMAVDEHGSLHFVETPPATQHVEIPAMEEVLQRFEDYRATIRSDSAHLLTQFRVVDFVRRAVGVGSVGTRCYVVMLEGPARIPLYLQVKEAPPSVLETYGRRPRVVPEGVASPSRGWNAHRVVTSQRILQAQSDPFLGWIEAWANPEQPRPADYYWRQFRDMKGSFRLEELPSSLFEDYVRLCGRLLARAHSQSPGGSVVEGYLGRSSKFDRAVTRWSVAYADQSERDFEALRQAVEVGRLPAERGV
jgi:uncharacterized protein (DUF2252 family)